MQFWTLDEIEQHAMADHEVGEEISPGVTITRRRILQVGVAGAGLLAMASATGSAMGLPRGAMRAGAGVEPLTIEQLLAEIRPRAMRMIASDSASSRPDESAYLDAVSRLLARYTPEEPWSLRPIGDQGWSMNAAGRIPPIVVFDIHMQPGSMIELHDHRHYNGVLRCNEGSVRCRNFDIVQPDGARLDIAGGEVPAADESFLIRENKDAVLVPGAYSTLSRDRDNIHHVEAGPEGCKLSDVFTYFRREARSYGLEWDAKPVSNRSDTYEVAWKD